MSKLKIYGMVAGVLFVVLAALMVYLNLFAIFTPADTQPVRSRENEEIILPQVKSFEECVAATNLVFTSYPAKCIAPNGKVFVNPGVERVKVITKTEKIK